MSLADILTQVRAEGEAEARRLETQTRELMEAQLQEARREAKDLMQRELETARRSIDQLRAQELPTAHLRVEREKLVMVNELLEQVRSQALEKLTHLKAKDRRELYKKLLAAAGPLEGHLRCPAKEAGTLGELTGLPLGEPLEEPGFIIEGEHQRLDLRFATLVEEAWSDHLKEVHQTLMSKSQG